MRSLAVTVAAFAALALPGAAGAATISYDGSGAITYTAGSGEKNHFFFYDDEGRIGISDSGAKTLEYPADRCEPGYVSYVVSCEVPTGVQASLGDSDDVADGSREFSFPVMFDGGDGDDVLRHDAFSTDPIVLNGGAGEDKLFGAEAGDTLNGGDGDDVVDGRDGDDRVEGGAGDDKLNGDGYAKQGTDVIDGGPGYDTIETDWDDKGDSSEGAPIHITLAGGADDGREGENDDVTNVEHLATNLPGSYSGTEGADSLDVNQVTGATTMYGFGGDDMLDLSDGDDTADGGAGNDHIEGGFGHDHITGGPGADVLFGDEPQGECSYIYCKPPYGNDVIDARDGVADQVDCGVGTDTAMVDPVDVVSDCETVIGAEQQQDPPPPPPPPTASLSVQFTKATIKNGFAVKIRASGPGKVAAKAKRGSRVVASRTVQTTGTTTLRLRFAKSVRKTLRRRTRLSVTVTFVATDGQTLQRTSKITLKG